MTLPVVQKQHRKPHSVWFFALQEHPREKMIIYCQKETPFLTRTVEFEARIWQHVINESSQETTNAQIVAS